MLGWKGLDAGIYEVMSSKLYLYGTKCLLSFCLPVYFRVLAEKLEHGLFTPVSMCWRGFDFWPLNMTVRWVFVVIRYSCSS
jgi:hypothetical protein